MKRIGILYPGDAAQRQANDPRQSRFLPLFEALWAAGAVAVPIVYSDDFVNEVRPQLLALDLVLVWHNPIEQGRDRTVLDGLLSDVSKQGVVVHTHPDTILKLGTKDVLLTVKHLPFGSDVLAIRSLAQLADELPLRLRQGPRVLKQHRGHSGIGIWKIQASPAAGDYVLQHAERGSVPEQLEFDAVLARLAGYFDNGGHMIDQAWNPRVVDGMVRAYMVRDKVGGFGHQAVIALNPNNPTPGPRLYSDATDERFQGLRAKLEANWVTMLCEATQLANKDLPYLWDIDFMFGAKHSSDEKHYELCEINVSSVSPFPPSVIAPLVNAALNNLTTTIR